MATVKFPYILSSTKIDDDFLLVCGTFEELPHDPVDGFHSKPVTPIDGGGPSQRLLDKVSIEVWLGQVETLNTSLGDNAAAIGLFDRLDKAGDG